MTEVEKCFIYWPGRYNLGQEGQFQQSYTQGKPLGQISRKHLDWVWLPITCPKLPMLLMTLVNIDPLSCWWLKVASSTNKNPMHLGTFPAQPHIKSLSQYPLLRLLYLSKISLTQKRAQLILGEPSLKTCSVGLQTPLITYHRQLTALLCSYALW